MLERIVNFLGQHKSISLLLNIYLISLTNSADRETDIREILTLQESRSYGKNLSVS